MRRPPGGALLVAAAVLLGPLSAAAAGSTAGPDDVGPVVPGSIPVHDVFALRLPISGSERVGSYEGVVHAAYAVPQGTVVYWSLRETEEPQEQDDGAGSTRSSALEVAVSDIEDRLAVLEGEPIQVLTGTLPGTRTPVRVEVLSVGTTATSILARWRLVPQDGDAVPLEGGGGLSGTLADDDRSVADVQLVDDATGRRLFPTVYREDVTQQDPGERCLCSTLPDTLPAEGLTLSAHFVRPDAGFRLVRLEVPGVEPGGPLGVG